MTAPSLLKELQALGNESTKRVLMRHGAREPFYGVRIEDLKKIQKRIKKDHQLALALFDTGNSDAMYLAGLIVDDERMTKKDLQRWVSKAYWPMLSEFTVAWVAAQGRFGWELGLKWIESKKESVAAAGWATLTNRVAITEDAELDIEALRRLLARVAETIHDQPNRVRHTMNGFVIGVGCYVKALTAQALTTARQVGAVHVDMGETACKVPSAEQYIKKVRDRGQIGRKRKTAKCL